MVLRYIRVSPRNAEALLRHPTLLRPFLDGPLSDPNFETPESSGLWSRWFGRAGRRRTPGATHLEGREPGDEGDADKSWNAIHFLLTGSAQDAAFPAGFILVGGTTVGDEDVGYGPARLFAPAEVREIDAALSRINREVATRRFDGVAMDAADVYPQIWSRTDEDVFEYAWENLRALQEFVRRTVELDHGLLLLLT
ncbi:MAG: YfbM family protein [Verrucomicrobiales bacterium]|nr:YfbM family protein [Verrucomicrobiales bacterium]